MAAQFIVHRWTCPACRGICICWACRLLKPKTDIAPEQPSPQPPSVEVKDTATAKASAAAAKSPVSASTIAAAAPDTTTAVDTATDTAIASSDVPDEPPVEQMLGFNASRQIILDHYIESGSQARTLEWAKDNGHRVSQSTLARWVRKHRDQQEQQLELQKTCATCRPPPPPPLCMC